MKSGFVPLLVGVSMGFFFVANTGVYAASPTYELSPWFTYESTVACAGLGGEWSNITNTCVLKDHVTVQDGLIMVEKGASLNVSGVVLRISDSVKIANYGTINVDQYSTRKGEIYNDGTIDNYRGGLINAGIGEIYRHHVLSIVNWGIINNHEGGIILNRIGDFASGGTLVNNGTIENGGGFFCSGRFETRGIMVNKGEIQNQGKFDIYSIVDNRNGSRIRNGEHGVITIYGEDGVVNSGTIFNSGRFEIKSGFANKGFMDNYGLILNNGSTVNNSNGTIINHNTGSIDNRGVFDNYGNVTSVFGRISNAGNIKNYCGSVIEGTVSANPATNICTSTITATTTTITTITSTESTMQLIADPALYIWTSGATVAAVVLAVVLLLQRRRK